ncbi:unnamed protein product [Agarophyton chilense]
MSCCAEEFKKALGPLQSESTFAGLKIAFKGFRLQLKDITDRPRGFVAEIPNKKDEEQVGPIAAIESSFKSRASLNLDDAASVLRSLSISTKASSSTLTKTDLDSILNQKIQKALFSVTNKDPSHPKGGPVPSNGSNGNKPSKQKNKRKRNSTKNKDKQTIEEKGAQPQNCARDPNSFDCGSKTKYRGSSDCTEQSYETRRRLAKKEKEGVFQSGSTVSKDNQA